MLVHQWYWRKSILSYLSSPRRMIFFDLAKCDLVMTPGGAYVVDVLQANSAGATAAVKYVSASLRVGFIS